MSATDCHRSLAKGMFYQVVSSFSDADEESLRVSGTNYPAWVHDRYLQLPDTLPQSVRAQAQSIAGTQPTLMIRPPPSKIGCVPISPMTIRRRRLPK